MHAVLTVLAAIGALYALVAAYVGYLALCRQVALLVERRAMARLVCAVHTPSDFPAAPEEGTR